MTEMEKVKFLATYFYSDSWKDWDSGLNLKKLEVQGLCTADAGLTSVGEHVFSSLWSALRIERPENMTYFVLNYYPKISGYNIYDVIEVYIRTESGYISEEDLVYLKTISGADGRLGYLQPAQFSEDKNDFLDDVVIVRNDAGDEFYYHADDVNLYKVKGILYSYD